ncbi:MAG TPA: catalase [Oligoflexus sp.]|uniref:catalase n=1 Tax=Oligoflexus sp. TaxID=1971216 RepID=UPI002D2F6585|nr:catalase [Oligoflexus sp.]HYX33932.1 catalase [Oligoflexus sp.]
MIYPGSKLIIFLQCVYFFAGATNAFAEPLALYEEEIGEDEGMEFSTIVRDLRALQESYNPLQKGFHAKIHGCVSGTLTMLPDRSPLTREGLFAEEKSYRTVMRFSNGSAKSAGDSHRDVRGVGIKLFDVEGEKLLATQSTAKTQDFLLNNSPMNFSSEPREFADFILASARGASSVLWFLARHPIFTQRLFATTSTDVPNLTNARFWSQTPYRLGNKAMKYNIQRCGEASAGKADPNDGDYLRNDLARYLTQHAMCWEMGLQLQTDPVKTPIEVSTVEWTEELSPTLPVARITIPRQDITDSEVMAACEALAFTPWHTTEHHRPLGKVNRARRPAYAAGQKTLLQGLDPVEPTGFPVKILGE